MKKTSVIICSLVLACVLAAATFFTLATPAEKDTIGSQKALEIALKDAGIKAADAKDSKSVFTKKNQTQVLTLSLNSVKTIMIISLTQKAATSSAAASKSMMKKMSR